MVVRAVSCTYLGSVLYICHKGFSGLAVHNWDAYSELPLTCRAVWAIEGGHVSVCRKRAALKHNPSYHFSSTISPFPWEPSSPPQPPIQPRH